MDAHDAPIEASSKHKRSVLCTDSNLKKGSIGPTNSTQTDHNSVIFMVSGYHGHQTNHGVADFAKKRGLRDTNVWHSAEMRGGCIVAVRRRLVSANL